jgi:hypothetical protein
MTKIVVKKKAPASRDSAASKRAVRPVAHVAPLPTKKRASDPTVQTWRALAPLLVVDRNGETTHYRQFGDFVPEVRTWKNADSWLRVGKIEVCYVNQSEIDHWWTEYEDRCAQEDEEKFLVDEAEQEEIALRQRLAEIEQRKQARRSPDFNMGYNGGSAPPDKTRRESIDFEGDKRDLGSVRSNPGMPTPRELPRVPTREVPQQQNVSQTRTRPTRVGRPARKKA